MSSWPASPSLPQGYHRPSQKALSSPIKFITASSQNSPPSPRRALRAPYRRRMFGCCERGASAAPYSLASDNWRYGLGRQADKSPALRTRRVRAPPACFARPVHLVRLIYRNFCIAVCPMLSSSLCTSRALPVAWRARLAHDTSRPPRVRYILQWLLARRILVA